MTEQATELKIRERKPEGSLVATPVEDILNNPYRDDNVFMWMEDKIKGLKESYLVDGILATFEVTQDKWGKIYLAGGGHHRIEAARRLIKEGLADRIRGLFKNDEGKWCIKVVKKKYTKEQMLNMFMRENADMWGKDEQQNICMMTMQIKNHLDSILARTKNVEDFIAEVKSPYRLKMDDKAFTRTKNSGAGASLIVQYLGENTWSRPAIQMAIQLMNEDGPEGEKLRELAEKLPNITTAYKFKSLMVQEVDGEKVLSSAQDQDKAAKIIERESLSRNDIEKANKLKEEKGLDPLTALNQYVGDKKAELKVEKDAKKKPTSDTTTQAPSEAEQALQAITSARNFLRMATTAGNVSKSQYKSMENLVKDIVKDMTELKKKFGGNSKKK